MSDLIASVEVEPSGGKATASILWLHGLGADGHDFEPIVPDLTLPPAAAVRFVFPHAPLQPVTLNDGEIRPAWYDIRGIGPQYPEDEVGIRASEAGLHRLIRRENERGVPAERIVLAGYSQGGAVALHTALRYPQRLAGILALSTYLPLSGALAAERHAANHATPIFMAHGRYDELVPFEYGTISRDLLLAADHQVEWHEYPMEHQICMQELTDIGIWLRRVLRLEGS